MNSGLKIENIKKSDLKGDYILKTDKMIKRSKG